MDTKVLLAALIGFFAGGLLVSVAATTFEKPVEDPSSMMRMTADLQNRSGDDYDKAFISGMIAHHQAAIDMARMSDSRAQHDEIKQLSQQVITDQGREIDQMKQWQRQWGYAESAAQDHSMH